MKKRVISILLAVALCLSVLPASAAVGRDTTLEEMLAADLKQLGLFKGVSDTDFALRRTPDRTEALVMLIRLLGKESEAMSGRWTHPFADVPSWADKYVGYAYQTGLTNGVGETLFGGDTPASGYMYLTFVLRALGYSDENGLDFTWDNPYGLARTTGVLPEGTDTTDFWRADVVRVSYAALPVKLKNSDKALYERLIESGAFNREQYNTVYNPAAFQGSMTAKRGALSAEQISAACAPAVFYIDIYALNGTWAGSGSGFFISPDGFAITNFHVAANSSQLVITMQDGKTYSDVDILDGLQDRDLALLKVSGSDFPYLKLADSSEVAQGQKVYALGSPRGLENTMSEGIISNPKRLLGDLEYIQTTAPIAPGSSGGALLNEAGKVVGVTSSSIAGGSSGGNLNFAVPSNDIALLDHTSTTSYVVWEDNYYPGFEHAYDFGAFTGAKLVSQAETPLGFTCKYDAFDFYGIGDEEAVDRYVDALDCYVTALDKEGFAWTREEGVYYGQFEMPAETICTSVDLLKERTITVTVEHVPHYYTEAPDLPDLGWYMGGLPSKPYMENKSLMYSYNWSDFYNESDFRAILSKYYQWMEDDGYIRVRTDQDSVLFEGKGLSVVCRVSGPTVYVDVVLRYRR